MPLPSATAPPATLLLGGSQMSVIDSLGRNAPPLTVICVLASPAVTSSERKALVGVGVGGGVGDGVGQLGVLDVMVQSMRMWACAMGAKATSATAVPMAPMTGASERSHPEIPEKRIETREGYQLLRWVARARTTRRSVLGIAIPGRARRAAGA